MNLNIHTIMGYRTIARVIGIIDMILSIISAFLVTILVFFLVLSEATCDLTASDSDTKDAVGRYLVLAWILTLLAAVECCLEIYASWKLIEGTDQFVSAVNGLRACRIWRGISIFFLILYILTVIIWKIWISGVEPISQGLPALFVLLLRIVALGYVQQYMNELHQTLPTTHTATSGTDTCYKFGVSDAAPPAYSETVHVPVSKH